MDSYSVLVVSDRTKAVKWYEAFFGRAANGIDHEPVETYGNGVRHVVVLDPDRNSLSLAEAPTDWGGR